MGRINLGKVIPSNEIYQPRKDDGLKTVSKNIVGAINEVLENANNSGSNITNITNQTNAAKVAAQDAAKSAADANTTATEAKNKANEALTIASAADTKATSAQSTATAANQTAANANNNASNANRVAEQALAKANACLPLTGGTLTGSVTMSSGNLVGNPGGTISGYGKVYNAVWNDYAEFFERGEETEPGDIIALDESSKSEQYIKASSDSVCIVGVHSNTFAHLIGGEEPPEGEDYYEYNIKKFIPIGLSGRVYVKVIGKVKIGDYIGISNISGVGISIGKTANNQIVVGKALQNKTDSDIGLVRILIRS